MAVEGNKGSAVSIVVKKYSDLGSGASCCMGVNSFLLLYFIYLCISFETPVCGRGEEFQQECLDVCILKKNWLWAGERLFRTQEYSPLNLYELVILVSFPGNLRTFQVVYVVRNRRQMVKRFRNFQEMHSSWSVY